MGALESKKSWQGFFWQTYNHEYIYCSMNKLFSCIDFFSFPGNGENNGDDREELVDMDDKDDEHDWEIEVVIVVLDSFRELLVIILV